MGEKAMTLERVSISQWTTLWNYQHSLVKREVMINNEDFREMVDKQLDKEGISMMLNYQGEASFSG